MAPRTSQDIERERMANTSYQMGDAEIIIKTDAEQGKLTFVSVVDLRIETRLPNYDFFGRARGVVPQRIGYLSANVILVQEKKINAVDLASEFAPPIIRPPLNDQNSKEDVQDVLFLRLASALDAVNLLTGGLNTEKLRKWATMMEGTPKYALEYKRTVKRKEMLAEMAQQNEAPAEFVMGRRIVRMIDHE